MVINWRSIDNPMINPKHIGALVSRHIAEVEAGRLRFFAEATGQTDPRYVDAAAALRRGDPALPVPPTFLFCLDMDAPNPRYAAHPSQHPQSGGRNQTIRRHHCRAGQLTQENMHGSTELTHLFLSAPALALRCRCRSLAAS